MNRPLKNASVLLGFDGGLWQRTQEHLVVWTKPVAPNAPHSGCLPAVHAAWWNLPSDPGVNIRFTIYRDQTSGLHVHHHILCVHGIPSRRTKPGVKANEGKRIFKTDFLPFKSLHPRRDNEACTRISKLRARITLASVK